MHSPSLVHRYLRLTAGTHRKPSSIVRRPFKEESQRGWRWGGGELNYGRRFILIFLVTSGLVSVRITFPPVSTQSADFRRRFIFVFRCCFNKSSLFFFFFFRKANIYKTFREGLISVLIISKMFSSQYLVMKIFPEAASARKTHHLKNNREYS